MLARASLSESDIRRMMTLPPAAIAIALRFPRDQIYSSPTFVPSTCAAKLVCAAHAGRSTTPLGYVYLGTAAMPPMGPTVPPARSPTAQRTFEQVDCKRGFLDGCDALVGALAAVIAALI